MSINIVDYIDPDHAEGLAAIPWEFDTSDIPRTRATIAGIFSAMSAHLPEVPGVGVTDHMVKSSDGLHDILVRVYRPEHLKGPSPALYWIHGGGMVFGDVSMDDFTCMSTAMAAGVVVASVEYRLALEHPHPIPVTDCYDGLAWFFDHADRLDVDRRRVAVGGASAGGGLAAATLLMARDRGRYAPCFQYLISPMIDDRDQNASHHFVVPAQTWSREANLAGWRALLGDAVGGPDVSSYAAPAREQNLAGLPPAYICVVNMDLFLDEDMDYARRLIHAGVPCELAVYPGGFHGSDVFVPTAPLSQRMIADRIGVLKRALGTG